jgi:hypothetical protein
MSAGTRNKVAHSSFLCACSRLMSDFPVFFAVNIQICARYGVFEGSDSLIILKNCLLFDRAIAF